MFYQCEKFAYHDDGVWQTLSVKSSQDENAFLSVTVKSGAQASFKADIIDPENPDHKIMTGCDQLVFNEDHPCFKPLKTFVESVINREPGDINNEEPKIVSPNYLMFLNGDKQIKFVFINALDKNLNEVKVKNNWFALNGARNLMKDVGALARKLSDGEAKI